MMMGAASSVAVTLSKMSQLPLKKRKKPDIEVSRDSESRSTEQVKKETNTDQSPGEAEKARATIEALEQLKEMLGAERNDEAEEALVGISRNALPISAVVNFPAHLKHYARVLKSRDSLKESGVSSAKNLLITGPSGSGKSEVVYSLAKEADIDVIPWSAANAEEALSAVNAVVSAGSSAVLLIEEIDIFKEGGRALVKVAELPGIFLAATTTDSPLTIDPAVVQAFGWQAEMPQHSCYSLKQVLWSRLSQLEKLDLSVDDVMAVALPHGVDTYILDNIIALTLTVAKENGDEEVNLDHLKRAISTFDEIPRPASQRAIQHLYF